MEEQKNTMEQEPDMEQLFEMLKAQMPGSDMEKEILVHVMLYILSM